MKSSILAGQLICGGFAGPTPSATFQAALKRGERGGAVLFRRNIESPEGVLELNRAIAAATPDDLPPLIAVDQEGGRVARLRAPLLVVPPMRVLARKKDPALLRRVARAQGEELSALGFTMNASPVLDVDTNPDNPIIGDRSFSRDPEEAAQLALAFADGLSDATILTCGKHYPGHGDTDKDSHLELPTVSHPKERLMNVELLPFRRAAAHGLDAFMTAHVVYPALDPGVPATQSHVICTDILRGELGFRGVVISDDLEMKAISQDTGATAVRAVAAGCDLLLVCSDEERQDLAVAALAREIDASPAFKARCEDALARGLAMRTKKRPTPDLGAFQAAISAHGGIREELLGITS
jgi:beta-N-acetylhexosaminidase